MAVIGSKGWIFQVKSIGPDGEKIIAQSNPFKDKGFFGRVFDDVINQQDAMSMPKTEQHLLPPSQNGQAAQDKYMEITVHLLRDGWEFMNDGTYWCNGRFRRQVK